MSVAWPHRLKVFGPNNDTPGGTQDDDGVYVDNPAVADETYVYDGWADVQDGGRMFKRESLGPFREDSNAVAFLQDTRKIGFIKPGMQAEIVWEDGSTDIADVVEVRRLDGTIFMKRV